jgi:cellulose synthase/poly-beta-1,6-N-acetylglucosamine synthase-like glycosyltransferase
MITELSEADQIPFISGIVPTLNNYATIETSLQAVINQTYPREKYEIHLKNDLYVVFSYSH